MTTTINNFGEEYTKWTSHKHPENPDFTDDPTTELTDEDFQNWLKNHK